jgi:hypothetical protein
MVGVWEHASGVPHHESVNNPIIKMIQGRRIDFKVVRNDNIRYSPFAQSQNEGVAAPVHATKDHQARQEVIKIMAERFAS